MANTPDTNSNHNNDNDKNNTNNENDTTFRIQLSRMGTRDEMPVEMREGNYEQDTTENGTPVFRDNSNRPDDALTDEQHDSVPHMSPDTMQFMLHLNEDLNSIHVNDPDAFDPVSIDDTPAHVTQYKPIMLNAFVSAATDAVNNVLTAHFACQLTFRRLKCTIEAINSHEFNVAGVFDKNDPAYTAKVNHLKTHDSDAVLNTMTTMFNNMSAAKDEFDNAMRHARIIVSVPMSIDPNSETMPDNKVNKDNEHGAYDPASIPDFDEVLGGIDQAQDALMQTIEIWRQGHNLSMQAEAWANGEEF